MLKTTPNLHTLSNGIRVTTFHLPSTETITVLILIKVGSRDEADQIGGVSHFLEHLLFKGTKKRPSPQEIAHILDGIGAQYNAFTAKEFTGFHITAAHDKLDLLLDLLSDVLLNSLFDEKEIERERGVIFEEMRLYFDTPSRSIGNIFEELLWPEHSLGRDIIGNETTLAAMKPKDITDYFRAQYRAERTLVSIAGKFNEARLLEKLEECFERFNGNKGAYEFSSPGNSPINIRIKEKETDQAHLALGVPSFGIFDPRREISELLGVILGGGMSSRLFVRVREELGLAYYVFSAPEHYQDAGYMASLAGVNVSKADLAIEAIIEEYKRIANEPITDRELTKGKEFIKGQLLLELESSFAMARLIGFKELLLTEREPLEDYFKRLDAITKEAVQDLSRELFLKNNFRLAMIGPFKSQEKFTKILEGDTIH